MSRNSNILYQQVIIAGFGGQGIILAGKLLAQTAMQAGKEVTFMPAYGAEVRGGTANCAVIIADEPIACPLVSKPDSLIAMNKASLTKFGPRAESGALVLINSSLVDDMPAFEQPLEIIDIPAGDLAVELGNVKVANMVALGAYLEKTGILSIDTAAECLKDVLAERYHKTLPLNIAALKRGAEFVNHTNTRF
ncbi:MAG TPA: 2-oxoacid:acceptor oxidoreductase family protein [Sedimentisphaerales bacterium]|nr:2-oxoacid:acceptor oxidoreductase family protein [Sedimentisphaerales bacterium]